MNKITHIAVAKKAYECLPDMIRNFINATEDEISFWAVFPDELDKDNLDNGYWMHSRKMIKNKGKFIWKHGSISLAIGALRWEFRKSYKLGDFKKARECLLLLMHYCTDVCSIPHLVFNDLDAYHSKFEDDIGKNIFLVTKSLKVSYKPISSPKSVYDSATMLAERIYVEQKDLILETYLKGKSVCTMQELKNGIVKECVQACVDFISHIYFEISQEDNLLDKD